MDKTLFSRVFITGSVYTLLLYLLISTKEEIEKTYFFFSTTIPYVITNKFNNKYCERFYNNKIYRTCYFLALKIFKYKLWPFLKKAEIFGHDHINLSFVLLGGKSMHVIEDGMANYVTTQYCLHKASMIKRIIFGSRFKQYLYGHNQYTSSITLTNADNYDYPNTVVNILDIKKMWEESSEEKKKYILAIYDVTNEDVEVLRSKSILLLTQCLSEDHIMSEIDKINIYKKVLAKENESEVIIKTHPRETTDYTIHFPRAVVFNKKIPFEIFELLHVNIRKAYTISSTAIYSLSKDVEIIVSGMPK